MIEEVSSSWPIAQSAPVLAAETVHIWSWDTQVVADAMPAYRAVLSPDECARADRFRFERDRMRFVGAHARMRQILAQYTGEDARQLVFDVDCNGKPKIAGEQNIRFNLSHSHNLALLAIAREIEIGVDVEHIRPVSNDIPGHFFSMPEQSALRGLSSDPDEWLRGFYSCWTRKEAFLKGIGLGLSAPLDSFAVSLVSEGAPKLSGVPPNATDTTGWALEHLEPARGYIGALAVKANAWSTLRFSCCAG